jgi:hypothetical protein
LASLQMRYSSPDQCLKNDLTGQVSSSNCCSTTETSHLTPRIISPSGNRYGNVSVLREKVRGIALQIAQFEELIRINDLLNEISGDLRQRVQHIKVVLGEEDDCAEEHVCMTGSELTNDLPFNPFANIINQSSYTRKSTFQKRLGDLTIRRKNLGNKDKSTPKEHTELPSTSGAKMLVMTNKRPFWNEQSQVYQLDFNGRVTQESAKNFQIEYQNRQVLQFGRIENGAYTLDFSSPFSAVQAFAIALASITQRLK